jgi:putative addiction module component (TIGR02574 family)
MKDNVSEILREALKLPPEARAAIAGFLLDSLDQIIDEGAEAAWEDEVLLRLKEIDEGKVKLVPWAEARRQITSLNRNSENSGHYFRHS